MGKSLSIALVSLTLQACSIVTSETPLFSSADSSGAPSLKPGLWSMPDADCAFDAKAAPSEWPKCANATQVTATTFGEASGGSRETIGYLLAAGDPPVLQMQAPPERKADEPTFVYAGLRPLAADRQGQVVEVKVWLALCAEPPPARQALEAKPRPLPPGLRPGKSGQYCVATDKAAVREAVGRSEAWAFGDEPTAMGLTARWVRER